MVEARDFLATAMATAGFVMPTPEALNQLAWHYVGRFALFAFTPIALMIVGILIADGGVR